MANDVEVSRPERKHAPDLELTRSSLAAFARDSAGLLDIGADAAVVAREAYVRARLQGVDDAQVESQIGIPPT